MHDCWMSSPLPLFSFSLWMCFAAVAVPMWLKLEKIIKEPQEEDKVSGDRLFLVWIKGNYQRTISSTCIYSHVIYSNMETIWADVHAQNKGKENILWPCNYTMHPSLLKVSVERYTPGHHGSLFCNLGAYLPPAHAVFFPLFIHYHVFLLFEFSHPINGLIAYFMFLDTLFLLRFDKQDKVPVVWKSLLY